MALCPSGQGVGLELRWALPAQVRTLSVSTFLGKVVSLWGFFVGKKKYIQKSEAAIAQLGERQTEDLEVPGSIPGFGNFRLLKKAICPFPNNGGKGK